MSSPTQNAVVKVLLAVGLPVMPNAPSIAALDDGPDPIWIV
jgi:hypothetical protein